MTRLEFLAFVSVILGPPLGLIGYIAWQHVRETRRRAAVIAFISMGRGETVFVEDRRFTPDEVFRQNEGAR